MFDALCNKLLHDDDEGEAICLAVQHVPPLKTRQIQAIVDWRVAQKEDPT